MKSFRQIRDDQKWLRKIQEKLQAGQSVPEPERRLWLKAVLSGALSRRQFA